MKKIKNFGKKIWYYVQLIDGLWSVPLGLLLITLVGYLFASIFGYTTGFYEPSVIQGLFIAVTLVIGVVNGVTLGMYFTFRGIFKWFYGEHRKNPETGKLEILNQSKIEWESFITPWQKFKLFFCVFFLLLAAMLVTLRMII